MLNPGARARRVAALLRLASALLVGMLGLIVAVNLVFFVVHAAHLLAYPYPLDYGEGPLLQQVNQLRSGMPVWALYADPAAPPYQVVNYPPVYPLAAWLLSLLVGDVLLAGRLVSLLATVGALVALWLLARGQRSGVRRSVVHRPSSIVHRPSLVILSFLALPIVREWAVVMRVDMLGVSLGLWALVVVQRVAGRRAVFWAVPLLLASLFTKPSLVAAPGAAVLWLLLRDWRRSVLFAAALALGGGLLFGLLHWLSGGWFFFHVVTANANEWQATLARGFWRGQWAIHGTLAVAGALCVAVWLGRIFAVRTWAARRARLLPFVLPLSYTLLGVLSAVGIGKVGAYLNYFLELYAGLVWVVAWTMDGGRWTMETRPPQRAIVYCLSSIILLMLVLGALLRYYPFWSQTYLKQAGIIEGENPPRLVFGRYSVWDDLRRERAVLATLSQANAALVTEVQAVDTPIFTDVPGVAAQAGRVSRVQAFEHRQLHDIGAWDQRGLLLDMANGRVPLVVLDYLGNWLTPEMIALIEHRYAQSGSRGTYDLYRPVEPGPRAPADLALPGGLRVTGYHLAPPSGQTYDFGEMLLLMLEITLDDDRRRTMDDSAGVSILSSASMRARIEAQSSIVNRQSSIVNLDVVVQLTSDGVVIQETTRPLLYGALPPAAWPADEAVQHMQVLALPPELLPGRYTLAVALRADGRELAPPQALTTIDVARQGGQIMGEGGYFVPAPFLEAWQSFGDALLGEPLMPAVPFAGFTEQCFVRGCLTLRDGQVERLPLGDLVVLGDAEGVAALAERPGLDARLGQMYAAYGGEAALGPPVTAAFTRGEWLVQYTRYARLELSTATGEARLGPLGVDYLRLPPGVVYRWP